MGKRGNNEGSIYQRADGRWVGSMSLGDGQRKSFYGRTRAEVAQKLTAALRDHDRGLPVARDERQTLAQYLASWLPIIKPTVRTSTWRRYEQMCRVYLVPALGKTPLAKLTAQQLNGLYAAQLEAGRSPRTVRYLHVTLHKALRDALELGLVARNVTELAKPPRKTRRDMRTFSPEQARAFLEAVRDDRLEALYVLALTTGMRQGELLALRWQDVDLRAGYLTVQRSVSRIGGQWVYADPKTEQGRRKITLTNLALEALRQHRSRQAAERLAIGPEWHDSTLVFTDELGQPLHPTAVYCSRFLPLCRRAGLPPIRLHDLRHTAATLLLLQGVNAKVVSEMLGHASVTITLTLYAHVLPDMQKDAAASLDRLLRA